MQTLDHGPLVSLYTVSRELGHGSEDLVRCVYGRVEMVRHRAEVVEYRVEQHREASRLGCRRSRLKMGVECDQLT